MYSVYVLYFQQFRGSLKSLNTGIVTVLNYGKDVPSSVSHVTMAHELGHNMGSQVSMRYNIYLVIIKNNCSIRMARFILCNILLINNDMH